MGGEGDAIGVRNEVKFKERWREIGGSGTIRQNIDVERSVGQAVDDRLRARLGLRETAVAGHAAPHGTVRGLQAEVEADDHLETGTPAGELGHFRRVGKVNEATK